MPTNKRIFDWLAVIPSVVTACPVLWLFANTGVWAQPANTTASKYSMGAVLEDKAKYASRIARRASSPLIMKQQELPARIDLCKDFVVPGEQGNSNSCVAWATAYAARTYYERIKQKWPVMSTDGLPLLEHIFSPSYVYNQLARCQPSPYSLNGTTCEGIPIDAALELIKDQGVSSWRKFPYVDIEPRTQPSIDAKTQAASYKIDGFKAVYIDFGLSSLRSTLANRDPVVFAMPVDLAFRANKGEIIQSISPMMTLGYHAMVICGYDDKDQAVTFMNSWGLAWGAKGFGRLSYGLIQQLYLNNSLQLYAMEQSTANPETPCQSVISNGSPVLLGDVNGDGKADFVGVGAPKLPNQGAVYTALSTGGFFDFWSTSTQPGRISNGSQVFLGDVNGDGKSDFVGVGAPGAANAGTVYVALSNGTGFNFWSWNSAPGVISNGSPLLMGDVNGDYKTTYRG